MKTTKMLIAAGLAAVVAAPAMAEGPQIYHYETQENYCPQGLQPIAMNGVICCGKPNQSQSWQQVMRHPVSQSKTVKQNGRVKSARVSCRAGVKGCY